MAQQTGIEWTDATWNPVVGCSIVSPGCTNCYAMKMAARIEAINHRAYLDEASGRNERAGKRSALTSTHYNGTTKPSKAGPVWTGKLALAPDHIISAPLQRKKPTRYFVNSMGDLFHEDVPDEWIDRVFAVMAWCPQHTFQVLTKRSARMRAYMRRHDIGLPNVWLGVSAEREQEADERIPDLLATPAAVRFVSAEPLLGPVDMGEWLAVEHITLNRSGHWTERTGRVSALDWVIVGGESGPGARPMHPDWARSIRDQCAAAGVPFFFKQWGEWGYERGVSMETHELVDARREVILPYQGGVTSGLMAYSRDAVVMAKLGKARAGRLLDGRTWDEFPTPAPRTQRIAAGDQSPTGAGAGAPSASAASTPE